VFASATWTGESRTFWTVLHNILSNIDITLIERMNGAVPDGRFPVARTGTAPSTYAPSRPATEPEL